MHPRTLAAVTAPPHGMWDRYVVQPASCWHAECHEKFYTCTLANSASFQTLVAPHSVWHTHVGSQKHINCIDQPYSMVRILIFPAAISQGIQLFIRKLLPSRTPTCLHMLHKLNPLSLGQLKTSGRIGREVTVNIKLLLTCAFQICSYCCCLRYQATFRMLQMAQTDGLPYLGYRNFHIAVKTCISSFILT
jgi:hypothetical protein